MCIVLQSQPGANLGGLAARAAPPPPLPPGYAFVDNAYCPAFGSSQDPSIVGSYSLILDPAKGRFKVGSYSLNLDPAKGMLICRHT